MFQPAIHAGSAVPMRPRVTAGVVSMVPEQPSNCRIPCYTVASLASHLTLDVVRMGNLPAGPIESVGAFPSAYAGYNPLASIRNPGGGHRRYGESRYNGTDYMTTIKPNEQTSGTGHKHILVINDTQEILDLFREILEDEGYRVTLASYAFQEVGDVARLDPDLVILDFIIGGESHGWQMLEKMKMSRPTASIPIIVCTAALNLVRELEGHLRAKEVFVVLKPFDIDDLLEAVQQALDSKGSTVPQTPM